MKAPTFIVKRLKKSLIFGLVTLPVLSPIAQADSYDLLSLYQSAKQYDAGIAAAKAAYLAVQEDQQIALAQLLPQINASASAGDSNSNSNQTPDQHFKSTNFGVSLSQPLIAFDSWYNYSASEQTSLRAQTTYLGAEQQLILDVASAYFGVLRAEEDLIVAKSLQAAVKRQYEQAKEQFDVGLIAITDVHEAQASFDAANTSRIQAEGGVTIAKEQLSRLSGKLVSSLHTLKQGYPSKLNDGETSADWVQAAEQNNLQIKAAEFALAELEATHKSAQAGHYPELSLSASYGSNKRNAFMPSHLDNEESSIALNLNVPIYSGGATQASVRKTRHLLEQAKFLLASSQREARISAKTEYINLRTSAQTVESLKQNIVSRESALEATREGYNVGTRNIVEVLDAERNYFTALRDYASARFDFVEGSLRIKRAAGTLSTADIEALNKWLEPSVK